MSVIFDNSFTKNFCDHFNCSYRWLYINWECKLSDSKKKLIQNYITGLPLYLEFDNLGKKTGKPGIWEILKEKTCNF